MKTIFNYSSISHSRAVKDTVLTTPLHPHAERDKNVANQYRSKMFNSNPPRPFGQTPNNFSTPTNGSLQPTATGVKVPRSGFRGTSSCQSNVNEPDPNGDVTLVVFPPAHPPQYKRKISSLFGSTSSSPSATTVSTESTESPQNN